MDSHPNRCCLAARATKRIDLVGRAEGVGQRGVVHAGDAEGVLDPELFEDVDGEGGTGEWGRGRVGALMRARAGEESV